MSPDTKARRKLSALMDRSNDLNNDMCTALGRLGEALDLLALWAERFPDDIQAKASLGLIKRCEEEGA